MKTHSIVECVRKDGVVYITVDDAGLTAADEKGRVAIMGVQEKSVNGEFPIEKIVPPSTIRVLQPGQLDIPVGLRGGTVVLEAETAPVAQEEETEHDEPEEEETTDEPEEEEEDEPEPVEKPVPKQHAPPHAKPKHPAKPAPKKLHKSHSSRR